MLFTGITGSGKTTSIHALLRDCSPQMRKIVCIEDPVEIPSPGVEQIEVDEQRGLGFADILKRILRRSPDMIVIGEIRGPGDCGSGGAGGAHRSLSGQHPPLRRTRRGPAPAEKPGSRP
jgi:hypothetical protein